MSKLLKSERENRKTAIAVVDANKLAIEGFWKQAGSPPPDAIKWAKAEAAKDISDLDKELDFLQKIEKAIDEIDATRSRWTAAKEALAKAKEDEAKKSAALKKAKAEDKGGSADLVDLLQSASELFHEHPDPTACPLCDSSEKVRGLSKRVDERLQAIGGVTTATKAHKNAKQLLDHATKTEAEERAKLKRLIHKFCKALVTAEKWPTDVKPSSALLSKAKSIAQLATPEELTDADLGSSADLITAFADAVEKGATKRHGQKAIHDQLKRAVKTYEENYAAQVELDKLIPLYEKVLEAIADERKAFVDAILKAIAKRVGELYEAVHPGEGLSKIELQLDPNKKSSLEIGAPFPGATDAPPQAFFSDSHLDTLGLCMFLALAELDSPKDKIIVLDDVLGSVDEPHVTRLIQMLYEEADRFQHCLVTTHYKPWREQYRWGHLKDGECHFVELIGWTHAHGIKHWKSIPPVERLRELLNASPPDPQEVCGKAGVILEAILDFITLLYRTKVPRQDGGYTLGDLLNSLNKELKAGLKVERLVVAADGTRSYQVVELGPIIKQLHDLAQARNVFGAHFNRLADHLHDSVAITFATHVLEIADALIDPAQGWPRSDKSGSYWANKKETRKLHPLKQPV